jgi:hypothetical protein
MPILGRSNRAPSQASFVATPASARVAFVLALLFLAPGSALAGAQECMTSYYRERLPTCVDDVLAQLRQMPTNSRSEPSTIVGFLAQLFKTSPQARERLVKVEPSEQVKTVELISLYRAGLPEEAQKFAAANNLSALSERLSAMRPAALDDVKPSSVAGDNDLLIGAYMASGDTALIRRILDNYAGADNGMAGDGFRIGYMMSKFGPDLTPKGRESVMVQAACARYQCKVDQAKFLRVMTLASAFWSLQSLATRDDGIKKTLSDFLEREPRLKNLVAAEQAAFGNYLTAIVLVGTLKVDLAGANREMYSAMNESASIYENLGSASDTFAPMTNPKK